MLHLHAEFFLFGMPAINVYKEFENTVAVDSRHKALYLIFAVVAINTLFLLYIAFLNA